MAKVSAQASGGGREGGRMEPLAAGEIVDERFEIIAPLGRGGGGAVYEVQDRRAGTPLALKMLAPKLARGRSLVRFVREYRVASRIKDTRFVRAYDFGASSNTYYFTMDLVRGGSLSAQAKGITLPPGVAVGLVLQLLSSLDSLHHLNITHRDIKPLNLLLDGPLPTTEGARGNHGSPLPILPTVRLTDFGIARVGDLNDESVLGQATGTPRYMAPEVLSRGVADPRVDLFATGVVLYELLTGHHPLSGTGNTRSVVEEFLTGEQEVEPARNVPEKLCPTLTDLLGRLLSRDPQERPRTAALVHDELWRWWQEARPPFQLPEQPPLRGSPYLASGPLVGREEELDRVEHFFVRLFDSQALSQQENLSARERQELLCPSVMVVSGVPGVGKSRLTWQILRMAQSLGAKALVGQCKQETEQAYEGLSGVLKLLSERDVLSETSSQSSSVGSGILSLECQLGEEQTAIEAVEEDQTRPALGAAVKPLAPAPGLPSWQRIPSIHDREYELLRREAADGVEAIRQHELRQRFFFEQTAALLLRWGVHHKTLIAVEDVQWADPSTGSLLAFLLRAVAIARGEGYPGKIAFCLTHRPAADDNAVHRLESMLENQAHLEQEPLRLELKPFPSEHSAELTAALLMEPLGPEVQLFSRALFRDLAATPLFVEQVLRILLYQGQLTLGRSDDQGRWSGQWNLDPTVAAQSQLPATVQEAIGERATRLSVQTQRLLALASVEGRQFTVAILARITELHENEVLDSLDEAAQEGFIQAVLETRGTTVAYGSSRHYRFVHDRYREALYERLDTEARRDIHLQLAEAITHLLGEGTETAEALGWHYACGGDHARAHAFNVTAADAALSTGAFERAAELYGAAFAAAERGGLAVDPALHGRYADACVATGAFDTAQYHYEQRIASLAPGLERWDTQRRAAELNYRRRDLKNATAPLEALLREMGHPVPRTDLGYALGLVLGAWRIPLLVLLAVLRHHFGGRRCRDPVRMTVLTRVWYMLTECYAFVDFRRSIYHATHYAVPAFWESDFAFRPALMGSMAYGATSMGFTVGGRAIREWATELLQQPTDADSAAVAYVLLLHAWFFSGQSRLDLVAPALQNAEASGDIQRRFMSRILAWIVLYFSGRRATAQVVGKSIANLGERYNLEGFEAWSMYLEAVQHQLAGRTSTAHQLFSQAQTVLERHGDILGSLSSHIQRVLSEALLSASSPEAPHDAIFREALELTKTLLARRLNGTSFYSRSLAAAACALWASPRATHAQWRELEKVHRQARRPCLAMRNETPVYLAVGAMIAAQKVQTKKVQKLLARSLSLAELYQNAEGLVLACRLAGMLYPPNSPEHRSYADREARFLAKMEALPASSFDQILEGHVGPGPWDTP